MLRKFAAGLLATALIAGPAFAQTSNSSVTPNSAPAVTAPATTNAKQSAGPGKTVKHAKLHKKTVKHVASRSHVKSTKMHQARHVKPAQSHQAKTSAKTSANTNTKTGTKTGAAAKRS